MPGWTEEIRTMAGTKSIQPHAVYSELVHGGGHLSLEQLLSL